MTNLFFHNKYILVIDIIFNQSSRMTQITGLLLTLLILVIIIIAAVIYAAHYRSCHRKMASDIIKGFWQCDDAFCREAELSSFVLYVEDINSKNMSGYIDIRADQTHGVNKSFTIDIDKIKYGPKAIKIKGHFSEEITGLPTHIKIKYDVYTAYLTVNGKPLASDEDDKEDVLYAKLIKDSDSTEKGRSY